MARAVLSRMGSRGCGHDLCVREDDDWVGEPPEGRHSRDRAKPGYWQNQWQATVARAVLPLLALLAVALILILR